MKLNLAEGDDDVDRCAWSLRQQAYGSIVNLQRCQNSIQIWSNGHPRIESGRLRIGARLYMVSW